MSVEMQPENRIKRPTTPKRTKRDVLSIFYEFIIVVFKIASVVVESTFRYYFPPAEKSVKDEIVLITGSGRGIGRELALLYASYGSIVVCLDVNEDGIRETVKEIENLGYPKAHFYVCDVSNRDQVFEVAKKVEKDVGHVTILVNNAGIMKSHSFLEHTVKEVQDTININVMGHFWTLQAFLPHMIETNRGHVLAIASLLGVDGLPNVVPYTASKFAVCGLMDALAKELHSNPDNKINLTTVDPYMVDTALLKSPFLRFPEIFPIRTPRYVAQVAVRAQRLNITEAGAPGYLLFICNVMRLFPLKSKILAFNFLKCGVDPDLRE